MSRVNVLPPLFSAVTIAAGQASTSAAVVLSDINPDGYLSVQVAITGDGTAKVEALVSNDGTNYVTAEGTTAIMTGKTKTPGNYLAAFTLPPCKKFKLVITETSGANSVTVTATVVVI